MNTLLRGLAVTGLGTAFAIGVAAAPAQAATTDPTLVANAAKGGACSGYSDASWSRADNVVTINSTVHSSYLFAGCRLKVVLTWTAPGGYVVGRISHDLPTACALTDATCPSTVYEPFRQGGVVAPFAIPFAESLTAVVSAR